MKKQYTAPVIHNEDLIVIDVMTASPEREVDNSFISGEDINW